VNERSAATKAQLRIGEHTDFGLITLLFHDSATSGEGLQVRVQGLDVRL